MLHAEKERQSYRCLERKNCPELPGCTIFSADVGAINAVEAGRPQRHSDAYHLAGSLKSRRAGRKAGVVAADVNRSRSVCWELQGCCKTETEEGNGRQQNAQGCILISYSRLLLQHSL